MNSSLEFIGDAELNNPIQSCYEDNLIADVNIDVEEIIREEFEGIGCKLSQIKSQNEWKLHEVTVGEGFHY